MDYVSDTGVNKRECNRHRSSLGIPQPAPCETVHLLRIKRVTVYIICILSAFVSLLEFLHFLAHECG